MTMPKDEDDCWSDVDESLLVQCDHSEIRDELCQEEDGDVSVCMCQQDNTSGKEEETVVACCHQVNRRDYLCVTDLSQQLWCEHHLCYTLMRIEPHPPSPLDHGPLLLSTADRPEVQAGKSLHMARELELHDTVDVRITCAADRWALHAINLLSAVRGFLAGVPVAREVPIFGDPWGTGHLVLGIIDELRFDVDSYSLTLLELKSRKTNRMPGKVQTRQHTLQVHVYKQLWDNLVKGNFSINFFLNKLNLTSAASQQLSKEVVHQTGSAPTSSLSQLLLTLTASAQALVCISRMEVEYVLQDTGSAIGRLNVAEDPDWFSRTFDHCVDLWRGKRPPRGVDVEEAWKCGRCEFSSLCRWRRNQDAMLLARNRQSASEQA